MLFIEITVAFTGLLAWEIVSRKRMKIQNKHYHELAKTEKGQAILNRSYHPCRNKNS